MAGKQAKILKQDHINDLLASASSTRYPQRNRAIALLSIRAGLRAGEIAKLSWDMVLAADGTIGHVIEDARHARLAVDIHARRLSPWWHDRTRRSRAD